MTQTATTLAADLPADPPAAGSDPKAAPHNVLELAAALSANLDEGFIVQIGTELMRVLRRGMETNPEVERGYLGTSRVAHAIAATVTPVQLVVQTDAPTAPPPATAGGAPSSVYVSADDPGAIGAGNIWLEVVFGDENGDGGDGRLWVRNSTDDGWNTGSPLSFSDAASTLVASPADVGELTLKDSGGSLLVDPTKLTLRGSKTLILDAVGVHLDATGGPALITGSADPSAGGGVAAPVGSLYIRVTGGVGTAYWKVAAGDTAWKGLPANALAAFDAGSSAIALTTTGVTTLTADTVLLAAGHVVTSLPTSDPGAVGELWNDAGTVKVSAG